MQFYKAKFKMALLIWPNIEQNLDNDRILFYCFLTHVYWMLSLVPLPCPTYFPFPEPPPVILFVPLEVLHSCKHDRGSSI